MNMNKRFLSLALAFVMVLGSLASLTPVLAAETAGEITDIDNHWAKSEIEKAVAKGYINGYEDDTFRPENKLIRGEMAKIVVEALNLEGEADLSEFKDVEGYWGEDYLSTAVANAILKGFPDKTIRPNGEILREHAFAVIARALKLEEAEEFDKNFADVDEIDKSVRGEVAALVNRGLVEGDENGLNPKASLKRAEMVALMNRVLDFEEEPEEPVEEELKVESVSAINAKEVEVKFGTKVAKSIAEQTSKYSITKANSVAADSVTIKEAELQDDNKTVILTLNEGATLNDKVDAKYLVTVSGIVNPENEKIEEYSQLLNLFDTVAPQVTEVAYPDSNSIKVSLSEPVNTISTGIASATKITLNGSNVVVPFGAYKLSDDKKSFTIDVNASGIERDKDYSIKVSDISDFAGNKITKFEGIINAVKDDVKPEVSSAKALSLGAIEVVFNEKVDMSSINSTFKFKIDGTVAGGVTMTNPSKDGKTFISKFSSPSVTAGNKVVTIYDYQDLSANKGNSYTKEITFAASNPAFVSTVGTVRNILGTNYIVFKLDRDITVTNATVSGTYVEDGVQKSTGSLTLLGKATVDALAKDEVAISTSTLPGSGDYKLAVNAGQLTDSFAQMNKKVDLTFAYNKSVVDATVTGTPAQQANLDKVRVSFSRDMGAEVLDASKYTVDGVQVFESAMFVNNKQTVELTLKAGSITKTESKIFKVSGITGVENITFNGVSPNPAKIVFTENVKPEMSKVELIAYDKIRVTFSEKITALASDFEVKINGVKTTQVPTIVGSGTDVIIITLKSADKLTSSTTPVSVEIVEGSNIKDINSPNANKAKSIVKNAVVNFQDTEYEAVQALEKTIGQFDFSASDDGKLATGKTAATARTAYNTAVIAMNNHGAEIAGSEIPSATGTSTEVMAVLKAAVLTAEAEEFAESADLTIKANYDELFTGATSLLQKAIDAGNAADNAKIVGGDQAKTDLAARTGALTLEAALLTTAIDAYDDLVVAINDVIADNTAANLTAASTAADNANTANTALNDIATATEDKLIADTATQIAKVTSSIANIKLTNLAATTVGGTWGNDNVAYDVTGVTFSTIETGAALDGAIISFSAANPTVVSAATNPSSAITITVNAVDKIFTGASAVSTVQKDVDASGAVTTTP